jgi:hypothetical protein
MLTLVFLAARELNQLAGEVKYRLLPFVADVPCGNRANLLKYKENLKNCCGYMYLFDSLEKTISNLRR